MKMIEKNNYSRRVNQRRKNWCTNKNKENLMGNLVKKAQQSIRITMGCVT